MNRMTRWAAMAGVVLVVGVGAVLLHAQARDGITRVLIDPGSLPLRVQAERTPPLQRGGVYQVYFSTPVLLPAIGARQRVFVLVNDVRPDGWIRVEYSDEVENQGSPRAELANPATLTIEQIPPVPVELTLRADGIAAISTRLNVDNQAARYWPVY